MITQENSEVFHRLDAELLGKHVDGVFLRVGRNDIRVVTMQVILVGWQSETCWDFEFLHYVNETFLKRI